MRRALLLALVVGCLVPASAQAQSVTANCDTAGARDSCDRWYTASSVVLSWQWSAGATNTTGCQNDDFTAEARVERSCVVEWPGTTITKKVWIGIDRTPPQLTGLRPDRPATATGWFNAPVGLTFLGSDKTSGVASCSSTTYSGPDGQGIPISGSCRDVAGNLGEGSLPINYDATAPRDPALEAVPGNRRVTLRWRTEPGAEAVVERLGGPVLYRGPGTEFVDSPLRNKRRYRYVVTLTDQAGNSSAARATAVPTTSRLLAPANGARLSEPPTLVWKPVKKARYYNVQLRHQGKVLSRWPKKARLRLQRSWKFAGRRFRLVPGRYCWYVWPGFGARAERRYGRMLGKSCFTIVRR